MLRYRGQLGGSDAGFAAQYRPATHLSECSFSAGTDGSHREARVRSQGGQVPLSDCQAGRSEAVTAEQRQKAEDHPVACPVRDTAEARRAVSSNVIWQLRKNASQAIWQQEAR